MKWPKEIDQITLMKDSDWTGLFPPLGFIEFEEGNDGGGDYYGLYWQWGKESQEPIICKLIHEESSLVPEYPDLKSFLSDFNHPKGAFSQGIGIDNSEFFLMPLLKAKVLAQNGEVIQAIEKLQTSVDLFGEYSDSWTLLSEQFRKSGDIPKAEKAALQSLKSNWAFGVPSQKAIINFEAINENGSFRDDPLVQRKSGLLSGGTYRNILTVDFERWLECIEVYRAEKDFQSAILLEQNYGYWMHLQEKAIKDKFNFEDQNWRNSFISRSLELIPQRKAVMERE